MTLPTLLALATSDLPLAGQRVLAKHPDINVREALASSNLTQDETLSTLLQYQMPGGPLAVNRYALARAARIEHVAADMDGWDWFYQHAARNPSLPKTDLAKLTDNFGSWNNATVFNAFCNPSTPEYARRRLSDDAAAVLIHAAHVDTEVGKAYTEIRAYELVAANSWMMEKPEQWGSTIQRAIIQQPEASRETLQTIVDGDKTLHMEAKKHPAYMDIDMRTFSVEQLLKTQSVAATIEAIRRSEYTTTHAVRAMDNGLPSPQILGRIINRFGLSSIKMLLGDHPMWQVASCSEARWLAPALNYLNHFDYENSQEAHTIIHILGTHQRHWESFVTLLGDWYGTALEAAETARRL